MPLQTQRRLLTIIRISASILWFERLSRWSFPVNRDIRKRLILFLFLSRAALCA